MRGDKTQQVAILSAVTTEQLVPPDHPIRAIKPVVTGPSTFAGLLLTYAYPVPFGRLRARPAQSWLRNRPTAGSLRLCSGRLRSAPGGTRSRWRRSARRCGCGPRLGSYFGGLMTTGVL